MSTQTTTATQENTGRTEPRAMLARIALADLPMPKHIHFYASSSILSLDLESVTDGQAWSRHLGGETGTYVNKDGRTYLSEGVIRWHGWSVQLHASDDRAPDVVLDDTTTAKLLALAGQ